MVRDLFYTPTKLAQHLISFIKKTSITSIADFCVGGGELLTAASNKWPMANYFGCDVSNHAINTIKKKHPNWKFSRCDFLNPRSRKNSQILKNKFDLVLLNPPFTCKGASRKMIVFDGLEFQMSTSMAFFVEAINYLSNEGVMYAILPQSVAYSKKDEKIRDYLKRKYNFRILEERNNQTFEKCAPNIVLASINDQNTFPINNTLKKIRIEVEVQQIQRGNISIHEIPRVEESSLYLVHSTNMRNNKIQNLNIRVENTKSKIKGPALLVHRVGQPSIEKLCVINENEVYALSDCVIGLKTLTTHESFLLKKLIEKNWKDFANLYKGTGARYITIKRLEKFLNIKT